MDRVKESSQKIELTKVWRGYVIYTQPQEFNSAFTTPGKHLSNPFFAAPLDRDFTITQGNLFPCLVILPDIQPEFL